MQGFSDICARESKALLQDVTQEEYILWKSSSCSKAFIKRLESDILALQNAWGAGSYTQESAASTAMLNAKMIGVGEGFYQAIELFNTLREVENDGESNKETGSTWT